MTKSSPAYTVRLLPALTQGRIKIGDIVENKGNIFKAGQLTVLHQTGTKMQLYLCEYGTENILAPISKKAKFVVDGDHLYKSYAKIEKGVALIRCSHCKTML